tara:strand:+ start:1131 stop:1352 length:222 start_codon:yes stop_codon:yes gene_type:complete
MQRHAKNKYRKKKGPTMFGMLGMGAGSIFRNKRLEKQHDKLHEQGDNKNNNNKTNFNEDKPRVTKVPVSKKEE